MNRVNPWWPSVRTDQPVKWGEVLERVLDAVEVVCRALAEKEQGGKKGAPKTPRMAPPPPPASPPTVMVVDPFVDAAKVLGVELTADADEIRAALRRRMSESRVHPDHGGDGDLAKKLIAAKNLLVERIRGQHADA